MKFSGEFCPDVQYVKINCDNLQTVDLFNFPTGLMQLSFTEKNLAKTENLKRLLEIDRLFS